ncbi:MAG: DUF4326 domain-containing protein [Microgenomates group bacterium]
MITIKNKKTYSGEGVYIGRPSTLGNPYSHMSGTLAKYKCSTRKESIEKYREWLKEEWGKNGAVKKELRRLFLIYKTTRELNLICWCHPLPCHGEYIKEIILKMK